MVNYQKKKKKRLSSKITFLIKYPIYIFFFKISKNIKSYWLFLLKYFKKKYLYE
jgi:hypothetical protein